MPESRLSARVIPIAVIVALLLGLQFYSPPRVGLWANVFYDSLHVPVFGLIAVSLYFILSRHLDWPRSLVVAFASACLLGLLSEIAQIATSRDASWTDIVANCLGAASFLAIYVSIWPSQTTSAARRFLEAGVGVLVLGFALAPLIHVSAAYVERNLQQPVIADFDALFGRRLIRIQNAHYEVVPASANEPTFARVTLGSGPWPGIAFHDLWSDWTRNETLVINLAVEGTDELDLNLRVHDLKHREKKTFSDRFTRSFKLAAGDQEIRIALSDLRDAPRGRAMNMAEIEELIIFSDGSNPGRSFRIYGIHLE
jgi:VanZ family protein